MSTISFFKNKIFLILVVVLVASNFLFATETTSEKTYVIIIKLSAVITMTLAFQGSSMVEHSAVNR